jgi:uncharacterized ferritin-like protein (DUF455 family)
MSHSSNNLPEALELRSYAGVLLRETEAKSKAERTMNLHTAWLAKQIALDINTHGVDEPGIPGRPEKPLLVAPREVGRRSMVTIEGRAALIHALAHIEFNAINLALDAVWRFADMPLDFYADWLKVAAEEALHFSLLSSHLQSLGFSYGDFAAHNSLWEMAEKTKGDVLARMALVPRTLEARGLDATPGVRSKLAQVGDMAAAEILDIILRDEIGHVEVGNHWYHWCCEQRGLDVLTTYQALAQRYKAPVLRGPFNLEARRQAGFMESEIAALRGES